MPRRCTSGISNIHRVEVGCWEQSLSSTFCTSKQWSLRSMGCSSTQAEPSLDQLVPESAELNPDVSSLRDQHQVSIRCLVLEHYHPGCIHLLKQLSFLIVFPFSSSMFSHFEPVLLILGNHANHIVNHQSINHPQQTMMTSQPASIIINSPLLATICHGSTINSP